MIKDRCLTKSRFKLAMECPRKFFYIGKGFVKKQKLCVLISLLLISIIPNFNLSTMEMRREDEQPSREKAENLSSLPDELWISILEQLIENTSGINNIMRSVNRFGMCCKYAQEIVSSDLITNQIAWRIAKYLVDADYVYRLPKKLDKIKYTSGSSLRPYKAVLNEFTHYNLTLYFACKLGPGRGIYSRERTMILSKNRSYAFFESFDWIN